MVLKKEYFSLIDSLRHVYLLLWPFKIAEVSISDTMNDENRIKWRVHVRKAICSIKNILRLYLVKPIQT